MFTDPEIIEAAGVLEMISQSPEQQQLYDSRLKFQLDEAARLEQARDEGEAKGRVEGRVEGVLIGRVMALQELLGMTPSTSDELSTINLRRNSSEATCGTVAA
jgi:predicted transposase YdaD